MRTTGKLAVLLLLGLPGASAESVVGERVVVELRAIATQYEKSGSYGDSDMAASGGVVLAPDQRGFTYLAAGDFDGTGRSAPFGYCMNASGGLPADGAIDDRKAWLLDRAPHVWWARIRAIPAEIGKVSFELEWEHWEATRKGNHRKVAGDRRTVVLREGERHVLDFVDEPPGPETYCYRNLVIDVTARVEEDPDFADRRLTYDLWHEHVDARGNVQRRRFQAAAKHGETLRASFVPLRFPVADLRGPRRESYESILEVSAEMLGRLREDGRIEVRFGAGRWVDLEEAGTPRRGGIGDGGNTVVLVTPDEPIRLELPKPRGRNGVVVERPRPGGPDEKTTLSVDSAVFYAGSRDRFILTVRPAR